mgnify:CR=1 FL=1
MIVGGCDVGSLTSKAVVMKDGKVLGSMLIKSKARPGESAEEVMNGACAAAGVERREIMFCVGTGYGRDRIGFVNEAVSEIACHGRGARWMVPTARTIIDIGGQDCKAIRLDAEGTVTKFVTNDKCASGTGRFLEVMARAMEMACSQVVGAASSPAAASSRAGVALMDKKSPPPDLLRRRAPGIPLGLSGDTRICCFATVVP